MYCKSFLKARRVYETSDSLRPKVLSTAQQSRKFLRTVWCGDGTSHESLQYPLQVCKHITSIDVVSRGPSAEDCQLFCVYTINPATVSHANGTFQSTAACTIIKTTKLSERMNLDFTCGCISDYHPPAYAYDTYDILGLQVDLLLWAL